jgi:hypothetical protein
MRNIFCPTCVVGKIRPSLSTTSPNSQDSARHDRAESFGVFHTPFGPLRFSGLMDDLPAAAFLGFMKRGRRKARDDCSIVASSDSLTGIGTGCPPLGLNAPRRSGNGNSSFRFFRRSEPDRETDFMTCTIRSLLRCVPPALRIARRKLKPRCANAVLPRHARRPRSEKVPWGAIAFVTLRFAAA